MSGFWLVEVVLSDHFISYLGMKYISSSFSSYVYCWNFKRCLLRFPVVFQLEKILFTAKLVLQGRDPLCGPHLHVCLSFYPYNGKINIAIISVLQLRSLQKYTFK